MRIAACMIALSIAALVPMVTAGPSGERTASEFDIKDLAWMEGRWVCRQKGDLLEETWSAPNGDCMMGMFRWMKGDKVWMYELMTIIADGDEIVFRLKHFDRKMVGWEEKDESITARLTEVSDKRAVFSGADGGRFEYRLDGKGGLSVQVGGGEGKAAGRVFKFRRK